MSCFHPLIAFPGKITANGKVQYIPVKDPEKYYSYFFDKKEVEFRYNLAGDINKAITLPCGHCIGCRLDKSREWALRCMCELKENPLAIFVTLTYNDFKAPRTYFPDPETGEAIPALTLRLDDLQRFWKRLRKSLPDTKIRYFACGEYGKETFRPHYHAIIFGYRPDDLKLRERHDTGNYYVSESLARIWSNGNVLVTDVSFDTCAYVARYTAKKFMTLEDEFFESHNMEKPFLVMSRRPGIGWSYMEHNRQYFELDHVYVNGYDPVDGSVPRSWIRKIETIDPEIAEYCRKKRKTSGSVYEITISRLRTVPYEKLLKDAEYNLVQRARAIQRNKI